MQLTEFINQESFCCIIFSNTFPDEEIFHLTHKTDGFFTSAKPTGSIEGCWITFFEGKGVNSAARKCEDLLQKMLGKYEGKED